LFPRAVGRDLVRPVEQLGVDAIAHNQSINPILARASALVTSDAQHRQLADKVSENDCAFTRQLGVRTIFKTVGFQVFVRPARYIGPKCANFGIYGMAALGGFYWLLRPAPAVGNQSLAS